MTPQISVIIPLYNEEKYISECLVSLTQQTLKPLEIIVVDDGSTDASFKIAKKFDVRIFKIEHGGPGKAKNFASRKAKGNLIVFIDADMSLNRDYIKKIILPIVKGESTCTYTTEEFVKNTNNIWSMCWNINGDLPKNRRVRIDKKYKEFAFRAILKTTFLATDGFDSSYGYFDDGSLREFGIFPKAVNNAICYHYNPDSLIEVLSAARWIGRSKFFKLTIRNLLKYSLINSLRVSFQKIERGAPKFYCIFKIIFDFGIILGILSKSSKSNYAK